jgi:hypothetical protein
MLSAAGIAASSASVSRGYSFARLNTALRASDGEGMLFLTGIGRPPSRSASVDGMQR